MDLTPPALTRSPSSPSHTYCPSERSSLDYPSPGLVEQQYKLASIYGTDTPCSLPPAMDTENALPPLDAMGQSDWSTSHVIHPSSSASAMPSIISAGCEVFNGYDSTLPPPYGHGLYHHSHQAHAGHSTSTPPPMSNPARSPLMNISGTSAPYSSANTVPGSLTHRVKMETVCDYSPAMEVSHYPSPRSIHSGFGPETLSYTSNTSGYLSDGQTSWQRADFQEPESVYSSPSAVSFMQDTRRPYRVAKTRRPPRRMTTREEANFQCEVKGCGKLFSRSYNFKAHMETHDEKRDYPFPCQINDCNKKFVRKTDLQRHHQSVHMKERNHKCDFCARLFARKDTLRRHMEDGCSKRFDIGTLEMRADTFDGLPHGVRAPMAGHLGHLVSPPSGSLPPMAIPPLGSSGLIGQVPPLNPSHWAR